MDVIRDRQVVTVGQIARDLVLRVRELPERGSSAAVIRRLEMLGGKGANQAVGLTQLGMHVALVAAVGDDEAGGRLLEQATADGIDTSNVARRAGTPSALIVSVVEAGGWRYLEHIPPEVLLTPGDVHRAAPAFASAGTVVVQLQQPPQAALAAAELGRQCGCRVVLDGAPPREYVDSLLAASDVVRADAREAGLLTGHPIRNGGDAIAAGQQILQRGPTLAALAAGEDGNAIIWPEGSLIIPLADGPVTDTTGAGDAFIAALVTALAEGRGPAESGREAAAAAAHTVRHLGGRPRLPGTGSAPAHRKDHEKSTAWRRNTMTGEDRDKPHNQDR